MLFGDIPLRIPTSQAFDDLQGDNGYPCKIFAIANLLIFFRKRTQLRLQQNMLVIPPQESTLGLELFRQINFFFRRVPPLRNQNAT